MRQYTRERCPSCDQWVKILTEPASPDLAQESWAVHRTCCCLGQLGYGTCSGATFSQNIGMIYYCPRCEARVYSRWDDHEIGRDPLSIGPRFREQHRHGMVNGWSPVVQIAWVGVE